MFSDSKGYKLFEESVAKASSYETGEHLNCPPADTDVFVDFSASRECINYMMQRSLEHADEELRRFERHFSGGRNRMLWAEDFDDMFSQLRLLFKEKGVDSVCFPQLEDSNELNNTERFPLLHELGLPYFLQDEKVSIGETSMLQVFQPDMLLTDPGSLLFNSLSNKALGQLNNGNINLFITTVMQLLAHTEAAELFAEYNHIFKESEDGMRVLYRGTGSCDNYLMVVDNRRSAVLSHSALRPMLSCLQCGCCHSVCPVEQTVGKEAYNNIFTGPPAHVMLPYLENEREECHIPHACLLCGRCEIACPLQLPIREMVMAVRHDLHVRKVTNGKEHKVLEQSAAFLQSRTAMNQAPLFKKWKFGKWVAGAMEKACGPLQFAKASYNEQEAKPKS